MYVYMFVYESNLSDIQFANSRYFLLFHMLSFHFVDHFFCCAEVFKLTFNFAMSKLFIFVYVACAFGVISMRSFLRPMSRRFYFMGFFFLIFQEFKVLNLTFNPFCEWCQRAVQFYSFACDYSISSTIYWRHCQI